MHEPIELTVAEGKVDRSGVARIQPSLYEQLGLNEDNQKISITYNDKTIIRKVFADEFVDNLAISLREDAREELNVKAGDKVKIQQYESIGEKTEKGYAETKEKIKEKVQREEVKEE